MPPSQNGAGPSEYPWPEPLASDAYHGLAGRFVRAVAPESEADEAALLVQYLAAAGNLFGTGAYYQVEGDRHPARLFVALIGATAKGRKGTAWSRVRQVMAEADPEWATRAGSGLSSGEGPLWAVRDPVERMVPIKQGRPPKPTGEFEAQIEDPGISDKRLLIVESELSRHFDVMLRSGNTLSETVRRLWDGGTVHSMTKNSPLRATDPHVSIVGHIGREELRRKLTSTEAANGFANRFLWVAVRRRQKLPFGGDLPQQAVAELGFELAGMVERMRRLEDCRIRFRDDAAAKWSAVYGELSDEGAGGMVGEITQRAETQALRLAVTYALLDGAEAIGAAHLDAALAVWNYCAESAAWAFGARLGDPVADEILTALLRGNAGMTRTDIRDLFGRHQARQRIDAALTTLAATDRARPKVEETAGRPVERWYPT